MTAALPASGRSSPGEPAVPAAPSRARLLFWLVLAVAVCLGFAVRASRPALDQPLVVHDDARQHLFWVARLHDRSLFADDWIADYYEAQAPPGYRAAYWAATLVLDAVPASKLLPLGLTVLLAGAGLALGRGLWRRWDAAVLGATLLAWSAWQYDDIASATPRAFAMPLLTAQLALLAHGRLRLALAVLPLQALLYPLGCAVAVLTTGLWLIVRPERVDSGTCPRGPTAAHSWVHTLARRVRSRIRDLLWLGAATVLALVLVGLGQLDAARYGPTVTAAQARQMPEFRSGGRAAYFVSDPRQFWLTSTRSGLALSVPDPLLGGLSVLTIPFALAATLGAWIVAGRLGWTAPPPVPRRGALLLALLAASLILFAAAHVLLFALYLPARHVQFSLPIVWALAGGLCWALLGDRLAARISSVAGLRTTDLVAFAGIALLVVHAPPPGDFYVAGRHPAIYAYLRSTPPDTLIAALPGDGSILPLFGQRPVLASFEHALPYQPGYYLPLRERAEAIRAAYYAPTLGPLIRLIEQHGVDLVVANAEALERRRRAEREAPPALEAILRRCGVLHERELVVVPAACIREAGAAR